MNELPIQDEAQGVYGLALSHAVDGLLFAATARGLIRSADGGRTFTNSYESLNLPADLPTAAVALSPAYDRDLTVFAGVAGAVLRSRDGGERWQYATLRTPPPTVACLAVSPEYEKDAVVFAGTLEDGVFRSADRGATWASWNFGLIDLSVLCLALSSKYGEDETLLAGTETGVFRSSNGGRAWRETSFPTASAPVLSLAVSPNYAVDGTIYAGTETAGLWVSHDQARTWLPCTNINAETVNAIAIEQAGGRRIAVLSGTELFVSSDGGASFAGTNLAPGEEASPVCLAAATNTLFVGMSDGQIIPVRW